MAYTAGAFEAEDKPIVIRMCHNKKQIPAMASVNNITHL